MRRAPVSPLLSGLVIPGLGQLVNRQVGKGAMLVAAASLLFMLTLGLLVILRGTAGAPFIYTLF